MVRAGGALTSRDAPPAEKVKRIRLASDLAANTYTVVELEESVTYRPADEPGMADRWVNAWGESADPPSHWMPLPELPK